MTSTELEHAEKRMQQKWYDLAMAEQKGATVPTLERMYNAYMLVVEEYNRCTREIQDEQKICSSSPTIIIRQNLTEDQSSPRDGKRTKWAS